MESVQKHAKGGSSLLFLYLFLLFCIPCLTPLQAQLRFQAAVGGGPQVSDGTEVLSNAWTGGMNACHFASIDLDGDGRLDYVAFDRIGQRALCFDSSWTYLPMMEANLPPLQYWIQTHDYDQDGRKDIFTFNGISGIALYRNESEWVDGKFLLRFRQVSKGLPALMFGQDTPLYCTNTDYPVIADIDGDGDLDILNFWVPTSGDFLLYYRNYAQENLGRTDTFCLQIEDWSWGCFVESEESNVIYLDSCSFRMSASSEIPPQPKHAGSTLWAYQGEEGLYHLVLGDVGYPGLYHLFNGGTRTDAHIVRYDTVFPLSTPVRLYNFPVLSTVKYKDTLSYIFSPFDTDPFVAEGSQSVWRYVENGKGLAYSTLVEKDFMQKTMLDFGVGAVAVPFDYNGDGLMDLVVGNYGNRKDVYFDFGSWYTHMEASLSLLENVGTQTRPGFVLRDRDFLGLSRYGLRALYPAFSDLDGDGSQEMVLGMEDGRLWLFDLLSSSGMSDAIILDSAVLMDSSYLDVRCSGFSSPVFWDLDRDGYQDLVVGEKQRKWTINGKNKTMGGLSYWQNQGRKPGSAPQTGLFPDFILQTDSLGGVDVIDRDFSNFGYSRPSFAIDKDGNTFLACGGENGEIFIYDSIDGNLEGRFRFLGKAMASLDKIDVGIHASPLLYDWDADGNLELLIGNHSGGLQYFEAETWSVGPDVAVEDDILLSPENISDLGQLDWKLYPNPVGDYFFVELKVSGNFVLTDIHGKVVYRASLPVGKHRVDVNGIPSGLYLWKEVGAQFFGNKDSSVGRGGAERVKPMVVKVLKIR